MKKWAIVFVSVIFCISVLSLFAVTDSSSLSGTRTMIANLNPTTEAYISATQQAYAMPTASPAATAEYKPSSDSNNTSPSSTTQERIVLYSANLRIIAQAPDNVIRDISQLTEDLGGWIVSSSTSTRFDSQQNQQIYGTMSLRIPANQLEFTVDSIKSHAQTVVSEVISGNDVTTQYVDMSSRLKNLEASETQLQIIMKSAVDIEDVLATFSELTRTRGEIESIRGQLNYYDEASTYSAVTVNIDPIPATPTAYHEPQWSPARTVEQALGQLEVTLQQVTDGAIRTFIIGGPFLLVLLILVGIVWRASRSYLKRGK